jgi:hypothetical protein
MKLIREHINKFERGLDPKEAMGIGSWDDIRDFDAMDDVLNWTIHNIPFILKTKEIPENIIYPTNSISLFDEFYYSYLDDYFHKHIKLNGVYLNFEFIVRRVWNYLAKEGFKHPHIVKET